MLKYIVDVCDDYYKWGIAGLTKDEAHEYLIVIFSNYIYIFNHFNL